jgi:hypothetical protein
VCTTLGDECPFDRVEQSGTGLGMTDGSPTLLQDTSNIQTLESNFRERKTPLYLHYHVSCPLSSYHACTKWMNDGKVVCLSVLML